MASHSCIDIDLALHVTMQRQTTSTAHFSSEQLLLFVFTVYSLSSRRQATLWFVFDAEHSRGRWPNSYSTDNLLIITTFWCLVGTVPVWRSQQSVIHLVVVTPWYCTTRCTQKGSRCKVRWRLEAWSRPYMAYRLSPARVQPHDVVNAEPPALMSCPGSVSSSCTSCSGTRSSPAATWALTWTPAAPSPGRSGTAVAWTASPARTPEPVRIEPGAFSWSADAADGSLRMGRSLCLPCWNVTFHRHHQPRHCFYVTHFLSRAHCRNRK